MNGIRRIEIKHYSTFGLIIYFILLPFEYPLASFGTQSILKYVGIFVMLLNLIDIIAFQKGKIIYNPRILLTLVWILYSGMTYLWSSYQGAFEYYYMIYARNALMFVFVSAVEFTEEEANKIRKASVIGVVILLLYMTFVPGTVVYSSYQGRLALVAGNSHLDENYLSALILIGYIYVLHPLFAKKETFKIKAARIAFCVLCVYYIIATGSRSGLLAVGVVTLISMFKNVKRNVFMISLVILAIIIAFPYIVSILPAGFFERFSLTALTGNTLESGSRLIIWRGVIQRLNNIRLLFGYGAGSGDPIVRSFYNLNGAVHNFYLAHILELGLIGFTLFSAMILNTLKFVKNRNYESFILILGIMFIGLFLDLITAKFFWAAMMLGAISIGDNGEHVENDELYD